MTLFQAARSGGLIMQRDKKQYAANSETVCHFVVSFSGTEYKSDWLCWGGFAHSEYL